jgi:NAD-dependent DNA ligase
MIQNRDEEMYNLYGRERICQRQVDELIGLARGLCADRILNDPEVEFLEKWLAANIGITGYPVVATLYDRIRDILADGAVDADERQALFETLNSFSDTTFELGEVLKSADLPLCSPPPELSFVGRYYCFTGTFNFGGRRQCVEAVEERGAIAAKGVTRMTDYLVIGAYATESWKHSSWGNKVEKACEMRDSGTPISIISEQHWTSYL